MCFRHAIRSTEIGFAAPRRGHSLRLTARLRLLIVWSKEDLSPVTAHAPAGSCPAFEWYWLTQHTATGPGWIYELIYETEGSRVMGLGIVGIRDLVTTPTMPLCACNAVSGTDISCVAHQVTMLVGSASCLHVLHAVPGIHTANADCSVRCPVLA
eukprot:2087277-Rhodomonas_salina.5